MCQLPNWTLFLVKRSVYLYDMTVSKPKDFMHDSTLDLFCDHEDNDRSANEFAMEIEMKAAVLEVTVDYYMAEFM
jgi:hypothetical protein